MNPLEDDSRWTLTPKGWGEVMGISSAAVDALQGLPPGSSVLDMDTGQVTHLPGRWGDGLE